MIRGAIHAHMGLLLKIVNVMVISGEPGQTPHFLASNLGLHCLLLKFVRIFSGDTPIWHSFTRTCGMEN